MQVLPSFDPSLAMNGKINASSVDPGSKILLYNLSIYTLLLNFDNGDSALIHAFEANYWVLDGSTTTIDWIQYDHLNTTQPASSKVTATAYRSDEEITGIYPMSLTYNVSVGNTITTSQGSTLSIQNDGNPASTSLVEATPTGDGASAVSLTVGGVLKLGNATHHGSISFDNATITSDGSGNLTLNLVTASGLTVSGTIAGATLNVTSLNVSGVAGVGTLNAGLGTFAGGVTLSGGDITMGVHNIVSGNNITISGSMSAGGNANSFGNTSVGTLTLNNGASMAGGDLNLNAHNLASVGLINASGDITCTGVNYGAGTIHKVAKQVATLAAGTNPYSHNLGWTPDVIMGFVTVAGGGSATFGWNSASVNAVNLTNGAGAALHFDLWFMKL